MNTKIKKGQPNSPMLPPNPLENYPQSSDKDYNSTAILAPQRPSCSIRIVQALDHFLDRFDKVRRTGPQKFMALCSAHADKNRSLSIRETNDGTILFHCHAGCSSGDVLSGAGLSWADILPNKEFIPKPTAYPELELDYLVIEIWEADRDANKPITNDDLTRYKLALKRTGAELRKRQSPYSKGLRHPVHAFLWYGLGAWERAAHMPTESLVLPPFRDPQDFHWPVDNRAVTLIDCGESPNVYSARIERCLGAIAPLVVTARGRIYEC